jgi:hypothetical protein
VLSVHPHRDLAAGLDVGVGLAFLRHLLVDRREAFLVDDLSGVAVAVDGLDRAVAAVVDGHEVFHVVPLRGGNRTEHAVLTAAEDALVAHDAVRGGEAFAGVDRLRELHVHLD